MKKFIYTAMGVTAFFAVVTPALAYGRDYKGSTGTTIDNSGAKVTNMVVTSTTTGGVKANGGFVMTGNAGSVTGVGNVVNTTVVGDCGCTKGLTIDNSHASASNLVTTKTSTGNVTVGTVEKYSRNSRDSRSTGAKVFTGDAGSMTIVANVVNTTVVGL